MLTEIDASRIMELKKKENKNLLFEKIDGIYTYAVLIGPYSKFIAIKNNKSKKQFTSNFPDNEKIEGLTIDKLKEIVENNKLNKYKKKSANFTKKDIEKTK